MQALSAILRKVGRHLAFISFGLSWPDRWRPVPLQETEQSARRLDMNGRFAYQPSLQYYISGPFIL